MWVVRYLYTKKANISARGHNGSTCRQHTTLDAGKTKVSSHEVLATTSELLDFPHERRFVWGILHAPRRCLRNGQNNHQCSHLRGNSLLGQSKLKINATLTLNLGVSASSGTGTQTSTLFAVLRLLNCALHFTIYSTRDPLWLSTVASTHMSGFTGVDSR